MKKVAQQGIPVLMYHGISAQSLDPSAHRVHIGYEAFHEQMSWLYQQGYRSMSLAEFSKAEHTDSEGFGKSFIITFDDGFKSQLELAAPILTAFGFQACSFVVTDWLYESRMPGRLPVDILACDRLMDWNDVRQLLELGWEIGSHTASHIDCSDVSNEVLKHELASSKQAIQRELNVTPLAFAYPFGRYNAQAIDAVKQHYPMAFSVHDGHSLTSPAYQHRQHRIEINRHDTLDSFKQKISTGYASLGQSVKSRIRDYLYESLTIKDSIAKLM